MLAHSTNFSHQPIRDLAAEMVKMGLALDLPNYPDADYKHLETPASRKKLSWKTPKKEETEE